MASKNTNILELFEPDEIIQGKPTVDGLRRVFQETIGPIISCGARVIETARVDNERRATVEYFIEYLDTREQYKDNNNVPLHRTISDVADCYYGNTMDPFRHYPTATASTMAEGRCLRKALGLKIMAAEESLPPNVTEVSEIESVISTASENQMKGIRSIAHKLNINLSKLFEHMNMPDILSHDQALSMIKQLNNYQKGPNGNGEPIPQEILNNATNQS